jgi:hypothetical protein
MINSWPGITEIMIMLGLSWLFSFIIHHNSIQIIKLTWHLILYKRERKYFKKSVDPFFFFFKKKNNNNNPT